MGDSEKKYNLPVTVFLFFILYLNQDFLFGITKVLYIKLKESGVTYSDLGYLSMSSLSAYLKLFFGPFTDVYYSKRIGKRNTYIISVGLLLCMVTLFMSLNIEKFVGNLMIVNIAIYTFILTCLLWIQDIVIDGLGTEYLKDEHLGYCIAMQTVAQGIGSLLTFQGYILLESPKFNEEYLGNTGEPVVNLTVLYKFMAIWILGTSIASYCIVDEKTYLEDKVSEESIIKQGEIKSHDDSAQTNFSIKETFGMMFKTCIIPNWLAFLFLVYLQRFGNNFFEHTLNLKLTEDPAYNQEIVAKADMTFFPINLGVMFMIGKIDFSKNPMKIMQYTTLLRFVNNIVYYQFT